MNQNIIDRIVPFSGYEQSAPPGMGQLQAPYPGADFAPMQQTKTQYTTAVRVQERRSISRITMNVLQESELAGSKFFYRWTVKTKNGPQVVQGPSIDMAMCMIRNFGNCALDVTVEETGSHYIFKAILIDLESGFTYPRLFRQRKSQAIGSKYDADRQEDIVFQIGQSKAIRNVIKQYMPQWLIDQAIEKAFNAEVNSIQPENIATARAGCIRFFQGHGIDQETLEKKIGRKADLWTKTDIVEMRANATAIKEGRTTAREIFKSEAGAEAGAEATDQQETTTEAIEQEPATDPGEVDDAKSQLEVNYWNVDQWINLKSPGLKAHAELFKDSFALLSPNMRKQFQKKWERCKDLGPFPFAEDGSWTPISVGSPPETEQEPPPIGATEADQNPTPATDNMTEIGANFNSWFATNYPTIPGHRINNFIEDYCLEGGFPVDTYPDHIKQKMMDDADYANQMIDTYNQWVVDQKTGGV
jgi:uncharacterized protein YqeY